MIGRVIGEPLSVAQTAAETLFAHAPTADLSQSEVIRQTANRPWPLPREPWLMAQTWRDLLFAHWSFEPAEVAAVLPESLDLDTYDGRAWIGVTPFELSGLRPRGGLPVPGLSRFPELNVRTYVTVGDKPGIFFLSLDAANPLAVLAARRAYRLPYFRARMSIRRLDPDGIHYESDRTSADGEPAAFQGDYRPDGDVFRAELGSLEYFLAERYCLYTIDETGRPLRGEIQHPPWPLQTATADLRLNTMTRPWGIALPPEPPLLHYARLQRVLIWPLRPADDDEPVASSTPSVRPRPREPLGVSAITRLSGLRLIQRRRMSALATASPSAPARWGAR
jgi:uncharacterized protein YqjF (DUF2071 family)